MWTFVRHFGAVTQAWGCCVTWNISMELIKKQNNGFLKVSEHAGPPWIGIRDIFRDPKSQDPKDSRNTRVQTARRSTDHNHR